MIQLNQNLSRNNLINSSKTKPFSIDGLENKNIPLAYKPALINPPRQNGVNNFTKERVPVKSNSNLKFIPLAPCALSAAVKRGLSYQIRPVSSVMTGTVNSRVVLDRDSNMFLSNMANLLGSISIIKRHFHSKKSTFPQPFNPNNLGLDLTSRENLNNKQKNDSINAQTAELKFTRLPRTVRRSNLNIENIELNSEENINSPLHAVSANLLNDKKNKKGKGSAILKNSRKGYKSTPINPELKKIANTSPNLNNLINSNTGGEWENDNLMINDKNRGTLKSLYKRRSINNLRKIGLSTSFNGLKRSIAQRSVELSTNNTNSILSVKGRKGIYRTPSKRNYRNSRAKYWEKLWINKFTKIKEMGAISYAKSILGVSGSYNNLHRNPKLSMRSVLSNISRKIVKSQGLSKDITLGVSQNSRHFLNKQKFYPSPLKNLWLSYLNQKKLNILNKHTFNTFLATSKVVNYSFFKTSGATNSISLSTPNSLSIGKDNYNQIEGQIYSSPTPANMALVQGEMTSSTTLKSLYKLLKSFFKSVKSIISYPILHVSPNKLIINLFYYVKPTRQKMKDHKYYQKHIRKEGKLFKDNLLRSKFNKLKHRFNFILLLNKWSRAVLVNKRLSFNNSIQNLKSKLAPQTPKVYMKGSTKIELNNSNSVKFVGDSPTMWSEGSRHKDLKITELISYISNTALCFFTHSHSKKDSLRLSKGQSLKMSSALRSGSYPLEDFMTHPKLNKKSETLRYNLYIWVKTLIRLRLIINLFSQLNSEKDTTGSLTNFKSSLLSTMFYLNFITQLAQKDKSELSNTTDLIEEEIINTFEEPILLESYKDIKEAEILSLNLDKDKLEKIAKILNTASLSLSDKMLKALIEKKDNLILLKEQTRKGLEEILIALTEPEFELLERPITYNDDNYHIISFIKNTLHELYRNTLRLSFSVQSSLLSKPLHPIYKTLALPKGKSTSSLSKNKWENLLLKAKTTPSTTLRDRIQGKNNTSKVKVDNYLGAPSSAVLTNPNNMVIQPSSKLRSLPRIVSLNLYKFKFLISFLEKLFNKPIELNLIRLKYPYHESNILAQVLALSSKKYKFFLIMRKLFYTASIKHPSALATTSQADMFNIIPSYLSGLKVRLAGRLLTEKLIPRKTVKTFQLGSLSRGKVNFKTTSRITLKNKRGAYSFTVTTSHLLVNSKGAA
jgi:hypothetical protein